MGSIELSDETIEQINALKSEIATLKEQKAAMETELEAIRKAGFEVTIKITPGGITLGGDEVTRVEQALNAIVEVANKALREKLIEIKVVQEDISAKEDDLSALLVGAV